MFGIRASRFLFIYSNNMDNLHNFFNRLNLKSSGRWLSFGAGPESDWKIIIVSTTFIIFITILLNIFVFFQVDKGEIFVINEPEQLGERTLNLEILRETVLYYQNKAAEFEKTRSAPITGLVDPSL